MNKVVFFCGVMIFLTLGLIFLYEAQAGEPKVLIPEPSWDFGYIPTSSVISHYYLVKNVGTDSLKIKDVRPG